MDLFLSHFVSLHRASCFATVSSQWIPIRLSGLADFPAYLTHYSVTQIPCKLASLALSHLVCLSLQVDSDFSQQVISLPTSGWLPARAWVSSLISLQGLAGKMKGILLFDLASLKKKWHLWQNFHCQFIIMPLICVIKNIILHSLQYCQLEWNNEHYLPIHVIIGVICFI